MEMWRGRVRTTYNYAHNKHTHTHTQLDEQYVKRSQLETELMNEKHEKELEMLKAELEANMRELQDIQVRKLSGVPGICYFHI